MASLKEIVGREGRVFERETLACVGQLPNATVSSKSPFLLLPEIVTIPIEPYFGPGKYHRYRIDDFPSRAAHSYSSVRNKHTEFKGFLSGNHAFRDSNVSIDCDQGLGDMSNNELVSRGVQKVDIIIRAAQGTPVVLIEVESSSNVESTVAKLSIGLMSQLLYLRRRGMFIDKVKGFFMPVNEGYAEEVTGTFVDEDIQFVFTRIALKRDEVEDSIVQAWRNQKNLVPLLSNSFLSLPINPQSIQRCFGKNAVQVRSGLSIVIHDSEKKLYFKYSLESNSQELSLVVQGNNGNRPALSVYPVGLFLAFNQTFFQIPEMLPPIKKHDITSSAILIELVNGTIQALQELHELGKAHNDVRLENICFRPTDHTPVLIDFGRSCDVSKSLTTGRFGQSTMYKFHELSWNAGKLDFRQVSIMITYIQSTNASIDYHQIKVNDQAHQFLQQMFSQGMLNV